MSSRDPIGDLLGDGGDDLPPQSRLVQADGVLESLARSDEVYVGYPGYACAMRRYAGCVTNLPRRLGGHDCVRMEDEAAAAVAILAALKVVASVPEATHAYQVCYSEEGDRGKVQFCAFMDAISVVTATCMSALIRLDEDHAASLRAPITALAVLKHLWFSRHAEGGSVRLGGFVAENIWR